MTVADQVRGVEGDFVLREEKKLDCEDEKSLSGPETGGMAVVSNCEDAIDPKGGIDEGE